MVRFFDGRIFVFGLSSGFNSLLSSLRVVLRPYPDRRRRLVGLSIDVVDFHFGGGVDVLVCCFSAVVDAKVLWASVILLSRDGMGTCFLMLEPVGGGLGVLNRFGVFVMFSTSDLLVGLLGSGGPWWIRGVICRLQTPPATENPAIPDSCLFGTSSELVLNSS